MATTLGSWLTNSNPIGVQGQAGVAVDVECATTARGDAASQYGRPAPPGDQVGSEGGGVRVVEHRTQARLRLSHLLLPHDDLVFVGVSRRPPARAKIKQEQLEASDETVTRGPLGFGPLAIENSPSQGVLGRSRVG